MGIIIQETREKVNYYKTLHFLRLIIAYGYLLKLGIL